MVASIVRTNARIGRGIATAVRARPGAYLAVTAGVFLLNILLPPLVLSVARKPVDYFMVNPWLRRLPDYLASPAVPWHTKLEKLWDLALFWFSADSPYGGVEWGFAVDVGDLGRTLAMAALCGAYFVLWWRRRALVGASGWHAGIARQGGVAGALTGALGLSTGPCSVMGCGAPVIPVVGLAFVGLSSGTLAWLTQVSTVATTTVLVALTFGVVYLGWVVGALDCGGRQPRSVAPERPAPTRLADSVRSRVPGREGRQRGGSPGRSPPPSWPPS